MSMSTIWDGKLEPLSDFKLDEWLFKDDLDNNENNDLSPKLTKYEIVQQALHDIEDLGWKNTDCWLDECPLFEEAQVLKPSSEPQAKNEEKIEQLDLNYNQQQFSPKDGSILTEIHQQPPSNEDLFSISYENAATFILSNENVLYIDNEPYLSLSPLHPDWEKPVQQDEKNPTNAADQKMEIDVVDELIKNELDQWESDTCRSETSFVSTTVSDSSPKESQEETDDPDWKPESSDDRKYVRRSKPYGKSRSQEEKKRRKKEQNKNAATRYRQKKRAEFHEILEEEKLLREKKEKLEERVADIQGEIKCVKALMRDLFKAKGIIN